MEGFFSDWIYKRTGIMDTKVQVEKHVDSIVDERLKQQQQDFQKQTDDLSRQIIGLQNQVRDRNKPQRSARIAPIH
jgi:hypothetical protein